VEQVLYLFLLQLNPQEVDKETTVLEVYKEGQEVEHHQMVQVEEDLEMQVVILHLKVNLEEQTLFHIHLDLLEAVVEVLTKLEMLALTQLEEMVQQIL
tara:strand:- start:283 stop:576 length:294 start_codon:yes stop_codon:yes gene_type:complete